MDIQTDGAERREQLLTAGRALSTWLHDRQYDWEDDPPLRVEAPVATAPPLPQPLPVQAPPPLPPPPPVPPPPPAAPPTPVAAPAPVPTLAPEPPPIVIVAPLEAQPTLEEPEPAPAVEVAEAAPAPRVRVAFKAPEILPRLAPLARPAAIAAAAIMLLAGAGWVARSLWQQWQSAPQTAAAPAPSPKPSAAPVAKPAGRGARGGKGVGKLHVESEPSGAKVTIDGRVRGQTPVTIDGLSAGKHTVVLESAEGSVRRDAAIEAGETFEISESIYAGWLHIMAPFEMRLSEGGRAITLDENNQALLPPGRHQIRVQNRELAYQSVQTIDVEPGKTVSIGIVPAPSTLSVTANAPAEVLVDGQRVGETPLADFPINLGTRDIVVRSTSGVTKRFSMTITTAPARLDVDFSKP